MRWRTLLLEWALVAGIHVLPDAVPLVAEEAYDAYHALLDQYLEEMRQTFSGRVLFLDIHGGRPWTQNQGHANASSPGQALDVATVHRGTANGATVQGLLGIHGSAALTGPKR